MSCCLSGTEHEILSLLPLAIHSWFIVLHSLGSVRLRVSCFKGQCKGVFPFLFEVQANFFFFLEKKTRSLLNTTEKNAEEQMD